MIQPQMKRTRQIKIETYWNVNKDMVFKSNNEFRIKIETYWNVNGEIEGL